MASRGGGKIYYGDRREEDVTSRQTQTVRGQWTEPAKFVLDFAEGYVAIEIDVGTDALGRTTARHELARAGSAQYDTVLGGGLFDAIRAAVVQWGRDAGHIQPVNDSVDEKDPIGT
jgi:hypothetical protein